MSNNTNSSPVLKVTFGSSSSQKRDEALNHAMKQSSYFTNGTDANQVWGAEFVVTDIENLYKMLDLTSGWKTQVIQFNGKEIKSTEVRNILWCYRQKNKEKASSEWCDIDRFYRNDNNGFGCSQIQINYSEWREYGHIDTSGGCWIFDKEDLNNEINAYIESYSLCPVFDENKIRKVISKLPETINPMSNGGWGFVDINNAVWFYHKNEWFKIYGSGNGVFPGASAMVGIQKLTTREINETLQYSKLIDDDGAPARDRSDKVKPKSGCGATALSISCGFCSLLFFLSQNV